MYKHILLAIDLADEEKAVEGRVIKLHQLTQAKLSLIHVIEPMPPIYMGDVSSGSIGSDYFAVDWQKQAREMLTPVAQHLKIHTANIATPEGGVSREILNYAKNNDVDLIVVGSHGRHGLQLLLGSTANAVLHHAHCDVLTVRISDES